VDDPWACTLQLDSASAKWLDAKDSVLEKGQLQFESDPVNHTAYRLFSDKVIFNISCICPIAPKEKSAEALSGLQNQEPSFRVVKKISVSVFPQSRAFLLAPDRRMQQEINHCSVFS